MARPVKRLSARCVDTIGKPGRYADGDGLYLIVSPKGAKRWQFLFRWQGKLKEMGLGSQSGLGLSEVRNGLRGPQDGSERAQSHRPATGLP